MLAEQKRLTSLEIEKVCYARHAIVIYCLVFAIFLSDWKLPLGVSFSDLMAVVIAALTFFDIKKLRMGQLGFIFILLGIVFANSFIQMQINPFFSFNTLIVYTAKLLVYSFSLCSAFNVIRDNSLEKKLFSVISILTLIVLIISLYIYIVQTFRLSLPYEFFWKFTRMDRASYTFRGSSLIRMRGLSSEPAYFGGVLSLILAINYFNSYGFRFRRSIEILLLICSILSFSFSVLPIVVMIVFLNLYQKYQLTFLKEKWFIFAVIGIIGIIILLYDKFATAFFQRFIAIVNSQDGSASSRLFGSWAYIDHPFAGNGIGQTPAIWNNYAYVLSDLGIAPFFLSVMATLFLCRKNIFFGIFLIVISFQKGGYLFYYYWVLIFLLIIFSRNDSGNPRCSIQPSKLSENV